MSGARLTLVELEAYRAGSAAEPERGWAVRPRGVPPPPPGAVESTETIRASSLGYRTAEEGGDVTIYPAYLQQAYELDRQVPLAPGEGGAAIALGRLRLVNADGHWDAVAPHYSTDGRPVRVLAGRRGIDTARGLQLDPAYADLALVFAGLAQGWQLSEAELVVPLRDASYWLERPLQQDVFGGGGGLDGTPELAGRPRPKARGGTTGNPIRQVRPVLVDPVNRIYACSDGPGVIVQVYEGGAPVFTDAGNVSDLYAGSIPGGARRSDNSRCLFQLGRTPERTITADVVGYFPAAGHISGAAAIARYLMTEDMLLPPGLVDTAAFAALNAARPAVSGWYWSGEQDSDGLAAVGLLLRGIGAKLLGGRDGVLRPFRLAAILDETPPSATLGIGQGMALEPLALGAPLDPPAYRWRAGWGRNHTVQTSDLSPLLDDAGIQALAQDWRIAGWVSNGIQLAYRRPSDPPLMETALLLQADAEALVAETGAIWGVRRQPYALRLPAELGTARDLGDRLRLVWPAADLRPGRTALVYGEQIREGDAESTLLVLV